MTLISKDKGHRMFSSDAHGFVPSPRYLPNCLLQYGKGHASGLGRNRSAGGCARVEPKNAVIVGAEVPHTGLVVGQRRRTNRVRGVDSANEYGCGGILVS